MHSVESEEGCFVTIVREQKGNIIVEMHGGRAQSLLLTSSIHRCMVRCSSATPWHQCLVDAKFLLSIITVLSMILPDVALAADRYWRGSSNSHTTTKDWGNPTNWSTTPTGAVGSTVPGASDIAIFTSANLTRGTGGGVVIKNPVNVGGMRLTPSFTGSIHTGTASIAIGGSGLRIGSGHFRIGGSGTFFNSSGAFVMSGGTFRNGYGRNKINLSGNLLHLSGSLVFSGTIIFNGGVADQTFAYRNSTSARQVSSFSGIIVGAKGGTTIDDVIVSGATLRLQRLTVNNGNFWLSTPGGTGVILAVSGSITVANTAGAEIRTRSNVSASGDLVVNGTNGSITMTGGRLLLNGDKNQTLNLNGKPIYNLEVNSVGTAQADSVIVAADSQLLLSGALTITNGNLNLMDNSEVMVVNRGITVANDADAQLTTNSNIFASGTITVNTSSVLAITGGTLTLNDKGAQTVDFAGKRIFNLKVNNLGPTADDSVTVANGSQLLLSGSLTITNGTLNLMDNTEAMITGSGITLADDADAIITSNSTITASGTISSGAAASWAITGATLVLNGGTRRQAVDVNSAKLTALTVTRSSSGILTSDVTVLGTLTVNTGSTLAISSFSLYATGSSIVNYAKINEDTGKISHTGSNFVVGNSSYSRLDLFREGDSVYFTLTDTDENISGTTADTVTITVTLIRDGTTQDTETVTLTETAKESGIFRGSVVTKNEAASSQNGTLGYTKDAEINALYTDVQDGKKNSGGGTFQVTGGSSTASSGGGGGGGGGRRASESAPVQGPRKTPPPVRRDLKQTVKEKRAEEVKKKETVKKVLKTKAQLKKEQKAKQDARKKARTKKK